MILDGLYKRFTIYGRGFLVFSWIWGDGTELFGCGTLLESFQLNKKEGMNFTRIGRVPPR